jgi:hypothetical protein
MPLPATAAEVHAPSGCSVPARALRDQPAECPTASQLGGNAGGGCARRTGQRRPPLATVWLTLVDTRGSPDRHLHRRLRSHGGEDLRDGAPRPRGRRSPRGRQGPEGWRRPPPAAEGRHRRVNTFRPPRPGGVTSDRPPRAEASRWRSRPGSATRVPVAIQARASRKRRLTALAPRGDGDPGSRSHGLGDVSTRISGRNLRDAGSFCPSSQPPPRSHHRDSTVRSPFSVRILIDGMSDGPSPALSRRPTGAAAAPGRLGSSPSPRW